MLNSKTARLIIALLAAILIWGYVVGEVNPSKTKTIRNVPITYTYEDTLNERGLAIAGAEDEYLNVEISGARAILGDISPNDISATINVASAQKGESEMSISIRVPSGITVNNQSITRTKVMVENLSQKPVDINIAYTGDFEPNEQGSTVNMSSTQVLVSGAESLVDRVVSARGVIDASSVGEKLSALSCQLYAVDEEENEVAGVKLSQRNISVTSILARTKEVELVVPVTNKATDRYIREVTAPETVKIFGNVNDIEGVDLITANTIDISQIKESRDVELKFSLPEGISIAEGETPVVSVTVDAIEEKKFTFGADDITVEGKKDGFNYSLSSSLEIIVTAGDKKTVIDALSQNDFSLSVDVSKLETSGVTVLNIECARDVTEISSSIENVAVEMSLMETAEQSTSAEENTETGTEEETNNNEN